MWKLSNRNNYNKNKKRIRSSWRDENREPIKLCEGLVIPEEVYDISENRYMTLLIKGVVVYLLAAGGIGSYLTAIGSGFDQFLFNVIMLLTAILCAFLYHSWKSENLGYLIFFFIYSASIIFLKDFINSGFYAVINDTISVASDYFNTDGMTFYNERISDRYFAITISASMLGIAVNILLNNYILRRARYMVAIFIVVTINLVAFYMQKEPALIYTVMLISGIAMSMVLKGSGHYLLSRNDHIFKRKKKGLFYGLDHKSLLQGLLIASIYCISLILILSLFFNKDTFDILQKKNKYKEASKETVQNVIMLGFFGIANLYQSNGGINSGRLGGVSTIRLDHETDLTVAFTPYDHETLYIKNFNGKNYLPYTNIWKQSDKYIIEKSGLSKETESLKESFEEGKEKSAKGRMTIINVEAPVQIYAPYYAYDDVKILGLRSAINLDYYPLLNEDNLYCGDDLVRHEAYTDYLEVPLENKNSIRNLISETGLNRSDPPMVSVKKLADYYQGYVPYTIRPGATPRGKDFVNYFLENNKKGYCAHFASAATLIFRELGIPARYCEGYAISYSQILSNGEIIDGADYNDYFEGYSELGKTALVKVDASDADCHAWVEVYIDGKGWIPVEVTPASTMIEEEDNDDFWNAFRDWFGDGGDGQGGNIDPKKQGNDFSFHISDNVLRIFAYFVFAGIISAGLIFGIRKALPEIRYKKSLARADNSDKAILLYSHMLSKKKKRNKELRECVNYKEQVKKLNDILKEKESALNEKKLEEFILLLEKAGFQRKEISSEELKLIQEYISRFS